MRQKGELKTLKSFSLGVDTWLKFHEYTDKNNLIRSYVIQDLIENWLDERESK